MILPLIGQQCVVTYRDDEHLATVRKCYVNHLGQYRIELYGAWGYGIDFRADGIELIDVMVGGIKRNARAAFEEKYSAEQIDAMAEADKGPWKHHGIEKGTMSSSDPNPQNIPKYPGTVTRRVSASHPSTSNTPKTSAPLRLVRRPVKPN